MLLAESRRMIGRLAFSPDGTLLATRRSDYAIGLWDTLTWRTRVILQGHSRPVTSVRFSPDCRIVASSSADGSVRLWNVASAQPIRVLKPAFPEEKRTVHCLAFSPDSQLLATFGDIPRNRSLGRGEREASGRRWAFKRDWSSA